VVDGKNRSEEPEGKEEEKSQGAAWWVIAGGLASIVSLLGFFGIRNSGELGHTLFAGPAPSATAPHTYVPSPDTYHPVPDPGADTTITTPASTITTPASTTTYLPVTPTTTAFDPGTLDNSSTDRTPLTQTALLPQTFTDSRGVKYSLVAWGNHACGQAYGMSGNVQAALNSYRCTAAMTGDYLVDSATVTANSQVLVSVQIFPFDTASTALRVFNSFPANGSWDFGIWCPTTGLGRNACANGYGSARKHEYIRHEHRYLIEATALYTNQITDISADTWITPAAQKATDVCGPQNYAGN
jgi:hypothetical protein